MNRRIVALMAVTCALVVLGSGCKWFKGRSHSTTVPESDVLTPAPAGVTDTSMPLPSERLALGTPVSGAQFDTVLFAFDSAQVDPAEESKISAVADYLRNNSGASAVLEGHCDERGSAEYNLALGERRALAVRAFLIGAGIDGSRLQTKSLGMEMPKDPGHTEAAWSVNRRVETRIFQQ